METLGTVLVLGRIDLLLDFEVEDTECSAEDRSTLDTVEITGTVGLWPDESARKKSVVTVSPAVSSIMDDLSGTNGATAGGGGGE